MAGAIPLARTSLVTAVLPGSSVKTLTSTEAETGAESEPPAAAELSAATEPEAVDEGVGLDEPAETGSASGEDGEAAWSEEASKPSVDEETRSHDGT